MNEGELDRDLRLLTRDYPRLSSVLEFLINDPSVNAILKKSNDNMIGRMGYTDHGRVHARVVSLNALKILLIIKDFFKPTVISERDGDLEDSLIVTLIGAWLHDIGCSVTRDNHELIGVSLAQVLINKLLDNAYGSRDKSARLSVFINESILCHLGTYKPSSVEASIVCVADGTDITSGRARLSYALGGRDIHDLSAMSIESVLIKKNKKVIELHINMNSPAGVFQVEETLLKKLNSTKLREYFKVIVHIKGDKNKIEY